MQKLVSVSDTDKQIDTLFRELRTEGFFAERGLACCQTCGWAVVPDSSANVVFSTEQDEDDWENYAEGLYLAWQGDGKRVVEKVAGHGLWAEWNGSEHDRIIIHPERREVVRETK